MGSAELVLIVGMFSLGVAVYTVVSFLLAGTSDQDALAWLSEEKPEKSKSGFLEFSRPLVHNFTFHLARRVKGKDYRKKIEIRIKTAGLERELNVDEYIGLQILWGVMFPLILALLNLTLDLGFSYGLVFFAGLGGFFFPTLHTGNQKKVRYQQVILDLPFFIDLLALSTEAGLDFTEGIQRIVDKAPNSVLSQELSQYLQDIKLGAARADALRAMSKRLDIPEVTSFVAVLVDATTSGAKISDTLKQQSIQMRVERFTRAEKAGAKASQMILVPLMIFILPAVFIMVFGPIILQFLGQGGGS